MSRILEVALASILVLTTCGDILSPQTGSQAGNYSLRVEVDSVLLNVSVHDRRTNRTIPNLSIDDFLVYEDGVLQQVDQVIPGDAPFYPLLLLDNSGSTRAFLPLIKEAAIDFVNRLEPEDQVAVATFNSLVQLERDFTVNHDLVAQTIDRIDSIGGTAFYDALLTCVDYYFRGITGRTAIVVFTDGVDNRLEGPNTEGSRNDFPHLFRRVQEADPIIYLIFLDTRNEAPRTVVTPSSRQSRWPVPFPFPRRQQPQNPNRTDIYAEAREQMRQIADQTGGRMYALTGIQELSRIYGEIVDDLRAQYVLAYTPKHHTDDGEWHEIKVRVKNRSDVAVRTRKGYYAKSGPRSSY